MRSVTSTVHVGVSEQRQLLHIEWRAPARVMAAQVLNPSTLVHGPREKNQSMLSR